MTKSRILIIIAALLYLYGCSDSNNNDPIGLTDRPMNNTCLAGPSPELSLGVKLTSMYPYLSTTFPLSQRNSLIQKPGGSNEDWYIGTIQGAIYKFSKLGDGSDYSLVLDIQDRVADGTDPPPNELNEGGMLSIAFHPGFEQNGYLYVFYTGFVDGSEPAGVKFVSHLSRFTSNDNAVTFDPASETKLFSLDQFSVNHKGSTIAFGIDGYLYISLGDDNSANSTQLETNRTDALDPFSFLGSMLRIDVDSGVPYGIPPDNPYADGVNGLPEVFAKGLRNPYRWSFDRVQGDIYLGDVGSSEYEEINIITNAGNYGWPEREGYECFVSRYPDGTGCLTESDGLTPPIIAYDHSEGVSVLGGYVYRGSLIPELYGKYIFGDTFFQKIWQLRSDDLGSYFKEELISLPQEAGAWGFLTFAQDFDGELYAVSNRSIYKLEPNNDNSSIESIPTKLSETGCFDEVDPKITGSSLIPYDVNTELWTDGATKERWFALPDDRNIGVNPDGSFSFPEGSVLIKNFSINGRLVETRFLKHHVDGLWAGYSYEWNEQQTEAYLLSDGKTKFVENQAYSYPSRSQCLQCHNTAKNTVIGPEVLQLNGMFDYPSTGITANQLLTLEAIGVFSDALDADPKKLPALPKSDDISFSLEKRVLAYLHANCAYCHQPEGSGRGNFDLQYEENKKLSDYNLCNVSPSISNLGIANAKLISPGSPELSILSIRLRSTDFDRMPPLGRNIVDLDKVEMVDNYITSLSGLCD